MWLVLGLLAAGCGGTRLATVTERPPPLETVTRTMALETVAQPTGESIPDVQTYPFPTDTGGTQATRTTATAPVTTRTHALTPDERHPRIDGWWRVTFTPVHTDFPATVERAYWNMLPYCPQGSCSLAALSKRTKGGRLTGGLAFRFDPASASYVVRLHGANNCIASPSNRVVAAGAYRWVQEIRLAPTVTRDRAGETIATRVAGRETFTYTETRVALALHCARARPESYRLTLVRIGARL